MRSRETPRVSVAACIAVTFALGAVPARAQATDKFADAVINSVESVSGLGTSAYFALVLNSQLTTFPVATSSGAFTYTFDPATRTFARRVRTFGPWFVERAATLGRSRSVAFGASVEPVGFESLDGRRLSAAPVYARFRL